MTIKWPNCTKCHNKGYFYIVEHCDLPVLYDQRIDVPPTLPPYTEKEQFCDCHAGIEYQIIKNRMQHPEYENPFLNLTDSEILYVLEEASKDQKAIDSEFHVK